MKLQRASVAALGLSSFLSLACAQTPSPEEFGLTLAGNVFGGVGTLLNSPGVLQLGSSGDAIAPRVLAPNSSQPLVLSGTLQFLANVPGEPAGGSGNVFGGAGTLLLSPGVLQLGSPDGAIAPRVLAPDGSQPLVLSGTSQFGAIAPGEPAGGSGFLLRPQFPMISLTAPDGVIRLDPREWDGTFNGNPPARENPSVGNFPPPPRVLPVAGDGVIRVDPRESDGTFNGNPPARVPSPVPETSPSEKGNERPSPPVLEPPSQRDLGSAAGTGGAGERLYDLSVSVLSSWQVGVPLPDYGFITIQRPSPGDDYWYRLPHTVSVRGDLPEGVTLVQKGPGFHELARLAGTPTRPGNYPVTFQATMADGTKTKEVSLVLQVNEPGSFSFVTLIGYGRTLFLAGESIENGHAVTVATDRGMVSNGGDAAVYSLEVSGLPPGLKYEVLQREGTFYLVGTATEPGVYPVTLSWGPRDGAPLAQTSVSIQILPPDFVPGRRVELKASGRPLKQAVNYEAGTFQTPFFSVVDDLGRQIQSGYTLVSEGLPKGLEVRDHGAGNLPAIVGKPTESGLFRVRLKARFEDGSESEAVEYELQVDPSIKISDAAGTYDCLLERSEDLNEHNGGRLVVTVSKTGAVSGFVVNNFKRYPFSSRNAKLDKETGELSIQVPAAGLVFQGILTEESEGYSTPDRPVFVLSGTVCRVNRPEGAVSVRGQGASPFAKGASSLYASPHPINLMVVKGSPFSAPEAELGAPTGIGFSSLRISSSGLVTATVWAADGSAPVTSAGRVCETAGGGRFNAFFALNNTSGRSALMGSLFINESGDAAGQLDWHQNASNRGGFPDGIPLLNYEGVIGSRMVPQPKGLNLEGFEEGLRNAELEFTGSDGASEDVIALSVSEQAIAFADPSFERSAAASAAPSAAPSAAAGIEATQGRIRYNARTGILTGSLVWRDSATGQRRPVVFRGMRAPDGAGVMGHFTAPEKAGSGRLEAGQIRIRPGI